MGRTCSHLLIITSYFTLFLWLVSSVSGVFTLQRTSIGKGHAQCGGSGPRVAAALGSAVRKPMWIVNKSLDPGLTSLYYQYLFSTLTQIAQCCKHGAALLQVK